MTQRSGLVASVELQQTPQYAALNGLTTSAAEANPLQRFCEPVEQKLQSSGGSSSDDAEEELSKGWNAIITRAADTPHTEGGRSALAAFLVSLTQKRADGQQADSHYGVVQDMKVWSELPLLGQQIRTAWNYAADERAPEEEQQRWTNVNAFVATLVDQLADKANGTPDFSLFGLWTIRTALEEEVVSDPAVAAASVWFLYAASTLSSLSKSQKSFDGKVARGGFAHKDAEWTGFSPARWQVWQQRLDSVRSEVKGEETRKLLQAAIDAVGKTN